MNQDERRDESRRLAGEGLTEREIAARLGVSQPTVHRDLRGYEPDSRAEDLRQARALRAEASRLIDLQHRHRGLVAGPVIDGRQAQIPGPYVRTPESEARAREVLRLRRTAARIEHPIAA